MPAYNSGPVTPQQVAAITPNEVFGIAINWFAPRCPLLSRLPKIPDGSPVFQMVAHSYRPRTTTLGAAALVGDTTLTLADGSAIMQGDVLKLGTGEYVEVTADPAANVVTVRRGIAATTPAAQTSGSAVTIIGNSRTGAEDYPKAISSGTNTQTQYMQTFQHPYAVGGGVQTSSQYPLAPGAATPLAGYKMDAMQNCCDDIEVTGYFGKLEASSAAGGRAKAAGIRNILSTNVITAPTSAAAYKASDFQRDLLTRPRTTGGQPDVVVVASNWMDAFTIWSLPLNRIDQGQTVFGRSIKAFSCPFLGDVEIWEASLLPAFTAFSLTSQEARWRVKRALLDQPYAVTGDVSKGHMLAELALEVDNEFHHGWLENVTAFAAS